MKEKKYKENKKKRIENGGKGNLEKKKGQQENEGEIKKKAKGKEISK